MDVDHMIAGLKRAYFPDRVLALLESELSVVFDENLRANLREVVFDNYLAMRSQQAERWGKKRRTKHERLLEQIASACEALAALFDEIGRQEARDCPLEISLHYRFMVSTGKMKWSSLDAATQCLQFAAIARGKPPSVPKVRASTKRKDNLNTLIRKFAEVAHAAGHKHTEGTDLDGRRRHSPFVKATRILLEHVSSHPPSESAIAERIHEYGLLKGMLQTRIKGTNRQKSQAAAN